MSQNINLLGPAFRKSQQMLTLGRTLQMAALAVVTLSALQWYGQQQVSGLQQELASAQALLKVQGVHVERLKGEKAGQKGNTVLEGEVRRLESDLKAVRDSMSVLEGGALGNREGFSGYLRAFSQQALDGLWLTGFSVDGAGEVAIQGRVLRPDLVPAYIQKLNNEPALKGRAFSALEVRRPQPAATVPAKGGDQAAAEAPRYLEFALTANEPKTDGVALLGSGK